MDRIDMHRKRLFRRGYRSAYCVFKMPCDLLLAREGCRCMHFQHASFVFVRDRSYNKYLYIQRLIPLAAIFEDK